MCGLSHQSPGIIPLQVITHQTSFTVNIKVIYIHISCIITSAINFTRLHPSTKAIHIKTTFVFAFIFIHWPVLLYLQGHLSRYHQGVPQLLQLLGAIDPWT